MKVTMCDMCKFHKKDIAEEPCISCSANKGRFELDLAKHDKQIRATVIDEFLNQIEKQTTFYCGKDSKLRQIAEQLKE